MNNLGVAMIEPVGEHRGMKCYDFSLCTGLTTNSIPVTLYTCDETSVPACTPFEVKRTFVRVFGDDPKLLRALRYLRGTWQSLRDAKSWGATIAHFHLFHCTLLEWSTIRLAKMFGMRIVITVHDVRSYLESFGNHKAAAIYRSSDLVIVHNESSLQELMSSQYKIDRNRVRVISSGNYMSLTNSDVDQFEARQRLGLPLDAPLILFFGQIKKAKGLQVLLQAFAVVRKEHPEAKLVIAGQIWHHDFTEYQAEIDRLELTHSVIARIQFIVESEVGLYFRASTVAVLPYLKIYQSAVLFSAMSANCPVIVSNLQGFTDIVQDGHSGLVFRTGDSEHLAIQLNTVLSNPDIAKCLAEAGFQKMLHNFSWHEVALRTTEAYQSLDT